MRDTQLPEQRLLSPEQAAIYLGLRSRGAVYRLVASGQLPALRLANKLQPDLRDLDADKVPFPASCLTGRRWEDERPEADRHPNEAGARA